MPHKEGFCLCRAGEADAVVVPLLGARANSAAPLSNACWDELRGGLLSELREALLAVRDPAPESECAVRPAGRLHLSYTLASTHGGSSLQMAISPPTQQTLTCSPGAELTG